MPTEHDRLQRIFESDVVGIIEVDSNLTITRVNDGVLEMLGYLPNEILTKTIDDITHPDDRTTGIENFHLLVQGQNRVRYEKRYLTKTGETVPCLVGIQCGDRDAAGRPSWFLAFISPLTEIVAMRGQAQELSNKLDQVYRETAGALARAIESRDSYTAGHQESVAILAVQIGEKLGLTPERLYGIYLSGVVHDIGKIGVPPEFLSKVTKLSVLEFDFIKQHPQFGHEILKGVKSPWPLAEAAYQHHERLNGTGYPNKLMGNDILLEARIIAVADIVDSMMKPRPYRTAMGRVETERALIGGRGTELDPSIVDACLQLEVLTDQEPVH